MANALYDFGRQGFLDGSYDWSSDTIKTALLDSGSYTADLAADEFLSDVPGGAIVATSSALTGKTENAGVADADDVVFSSVTGSNADLLLIYQDTGTGSTSRLIALIDTATGFPFTPSGGSVTIAWDSGSNKIFKL